MDNDHDLKVCNEGNYEKECPIMDIHDRLLECQFHIIQMIINYHKPSYFRYSLNAFLSSFQSVKYLVNHETKKDESVKKVFDKYFKNLSKEKSFIKSISDSRDTVIHECNLSIASKANIGLFRGTRLKLAIEVPVNIFDDSATILNRYKSVFVREKGFIDKAHSSIGEQFGVEREWVVSKIGSKEIVELCLDAFEYLCAVVDEIHGIYGMELSISSIEKSGITDYRVILESDVDPSLPEQWGWIDF